MDYALSKKTLSVSETVFEGCLEQPIDLDFSLPDYCPDIQRILKCRVYPKIYTRNISGDRLEVEGAAEVKIMYLDAVKKSVRCSEQTIPFSCSFTMKTTPQNAIVKTMVKPEYLNCRALSPRRLDIHGAFSICASVMCKTEREFADAITGDDIQCKTRSIPLSSLAGFGQQQFTATDEIMLGGGKPPVESILRTDVQVVTTDCKAIANKLMLKGDIGIKMLYLADLDTGATEVLDYVVPFSEIVDVDGVDDGCICDVNVEVLTYDIRSKGDMMDKTPSIDIEVKLAATAVAYTTEEVTVITDAYSTMYDLNMVFSQTMLSNVKKQFKETCISKSTVETGSDEISRIIDLWNEPCTITVTEEENQLIASGKVNICILALNSEEIPFYAERVVDFTHPLGEGSLTEMTVQSMAQVTSISYRLNGANTLDLRSEIRMEISMFKKKSLRTVTEVTADEEHVRQRDTKAALTLYYAGHGESVWNIAREYSVSCDAVMAENELTDDKVLQGRMLLIPNI